MRIHLSNLLASEVSALGAVAELHRSAYPPTGYCTVHPLSAAQAAEFLTEAERLGLSPLNIRHYSQLKDYARTGVNRGRLRAELPRF